MSINDTGWAGPLKKTGALDGYKQKKISPGLGSDFVDLDLVDVLNSPKRDAILRDLAITSEYALSTTAGTFSVLTPCSLGARGCRLSPSKVGQ